MTTLIEQLIIKMGLQLEPNIKEKATELLRLLELRSTNVPLQINEYGKIVICTDLAATAMGIEFDKEQALKLSAMRKTQYANNKRMFEKLLDLSKILNVKDICIQLGINELTKKAEELLDVYKIVIANENTDIDITHPQYASMAVYQAAKLMKKKVSKTKFMPYSNLRPTQWQQLEHRWEKVLLKYGQIGKSSDTKLKDKLYAEEATVPSNKIATLTHKKIDIEHYDQWKHRMIVTAQAKIEQLKKDKIEKNS